MDMSLEPMRPSKEGTIVTEIEVAVDTGSAAQVIPANPAPDETEVPSLRPKAVLILSLCVCLTLSSPPGSQVSGASVNISVGG